MQARNWLNINRYNLSGVLEVTSLRYEPTPRNLGMEGVSPNSGGGITISNDAISIWYGILQLVQITMEDSQRKPGPVSSTSHHYYITNGKTKSVGIPASVCRANKWFSYSLCGFT